jgi:hypothetical protein
VRKIAARFGVNPETVPRISRPLVAPVVALKGSKPRAVHIQLRPDPLAH